MRIHLVELKSGIRRSREFEKKRLASYAVNVGTKCGHACSYCSTGAVLRMHKSFQQCGEDPFGYGYAIIDPNVHARVREDAGRIRERGVVQLCTTTDAWAPEAQEYGLGRKCLDAILSQPGWVVRLLTKNTSSLRQDFNLIDEHKDRILVGASITATPNRSTLMSVVEPHASSIQDRMDVMRQAHARGFRTYAMLCPLLPGIADSREQIGQLVQFASEIGSEEIFAEPVNARGPGLRLTQEALRRAGFQEEAAAVGAIRNEKGWSDYVTRLVSNIQRSAEEFYDVGRLRVLLYPSKLTAEDRQRIRRDDRGVVWLGKDSNRDVGN